MHIKISLQQIKQEAAPYNEREENWILFQIRPGLIFIAWLNRMDHVVAHERTNTLYWRKIQQK